MSTSDTPTDSPMGDEQLAAIVARARAATPGPWEVEDDDEAWELYAGRGELTHGSKLIKAPKPHPSNEFAEFWPKQADSEFIVHARDDVPALAAEIARLQRDLDDTRVALAVHSGIRDAFELPDDVRAAVSRALRATEADDQASGRA